ncbi:LOW QUALITY PROTEIN: uncharacterized protein EMH_0040600 [Eimeria mitis]|uniref:Uncharacterized protein n=1 Tax=Eimeria mitis TaxID=44415 RepID=U6JUI0_9EIME|nr:LOW QUALITY PROTEIN: uncharacterized protein EMH_0040600 [Eimeria mitis]CDJ28401.1 hypothetical protein EMH_0040600 [Eimeria mitis]
MSENSPNTSGASELADPHEDQSQPETDEPFQGESPPAAAVNSGELPSRGGSSSSITEDHHGKPSPVVPPLEGLSALDADRPGRAEAVELRAVEELEMPQPRSEDLFEWEKVPCETPYYLQGDASFETPEKQAERQALKTHQEVVAALEDTWSYFAKDSQNRVSKEEYARVLLRICLVLVPQLRGREVVDLIEEEWRQDSKGEEGLSRSAFFESFFQLADIWTPGIDGSVYAEFLKRLFRRITVKRARAKTGARMTKIKPFSEELLLRGPAPKLVQE